MKEKIIMWGAIIGLGILLFLIPTKGNALTKDEIKEYVNNQPFDFVQIKQDKEARSIEDIMKDTAQEMIQSEEESI